MNESSLLIKNIIKYLKDVYDGEKIEGLSQSFMYIWFLTLLVFK
tara:strand:+ start:2897 stop:3028 length:132 start_codon:yes stop_codon:yes gene_type:complete